MREKINMKFLLFLTAMTDQDNTQVLLKYQHEFIKLERIKFSWLPNENIK